ncbi:MAG TPA: zf-HC2 domain-containing protein [Candidatus Acidoferrum sp.]|jgi:anti-sigma factor RsiW|nr:zf-HC2 domain-containing protein [Candidatus Acidoferrum sp.]
MTDHLGELAALYALGMLEPAEERAADEHLAHCDACRRLLAQAESDVTAIAAAQEQFEPPARHVAPKPAPVIRRYAPWLAVAAAVLIAILPAGYLLEANLAMHQDMLANAQAIARVATSPHRTATFSGADARVMYAPDGSWYCIVIRGASAPLHVLWPHDGTMTMLGTAMPHGDVALLYLPKSHRMGHLMLMQGDRQVGQAQLVF